MPKQSRRGAKGTRQTLAGTLSHDELLRLAQDRQFFAGFDPASISRIDVPGRAPRRPVNTGQRVLRTEDFVALELELINLDVVVPAGGGTATLQARKGQAAYIVLRFPAQSIVEQAFYEADRKSSTVEPPTPPPVHSRIANSSRVVFRYDQKILADAHIDAVTYTLQGLLEACQCLPLSITANAGRSPVTRFVIGPLRGDLLRRQRAAFEKLSVGARAATLASTMHNLQLLWMGDQKTAHLLLRRAELRSDAMAIPTMEAGAEALTDPGKPKSAQSLHTASALAVIGAVGAIGLQVNRPPLSWYRRPPKPQRPGETDTALELPYRLLLSPNETGRFVHATVPQAFDATGCTPLWHTRLGRLDDSSGEVLEGPDANTEIRAIWARVGPGSQPSFFNGDWPANKAMPMPPDYPDTTTVPFRQPLSDLDRFEIVHESSNFRISDGNQEPIACKRLMLSALGGWLDVHGSWKVPDGLSVEEWVHQATQARDHYVKVVYKGYLLPFGHQVSLVEVSERKFHHDKPGNPAYVRKREFLIVRQPERDFPVMQLPGTAPLPYPSGQSPFTRYYHRQFPFSRVRIVTRVTPDLDDPYATSIPMSPPAMGKYGDLLFWPFVDGAAFPFKYVATDLDGRDVAFELPGLFIRNELSNPQGDTWRTQSEINFGIAQAAYLQASPSQRTAQLKRQRVCLAPSKKPGDTTCEIETITFGAEVDQLRLDSATSHGPLMYPSVQGANVRIPSLAYLAGGNGSNPATWNASYIAQPQGFDQGEVFLDIAGGAGLDFSRQGSRSGGFVQPNLQPSGLSRLSGPISGDVGTFNAGSFNGKDFFGKAINPLLFGCIPLGELISAFPINGDNLGKLPKFVSEAANAAQAFFGALGQAGDLTSTLEDLAKSAAQAAFDQAVQVAMRQLQPQIQTLDATTAAIANNIQQVMQAADQLSNAILNTATIFQPGDATFTAKLGDLQSALTGLLNAVNQRIGQLPASGLSSAVQNVVQQQLTPVLTRVQQIQAIVDDITRIPALLPQAKAFGDAIGALMVPPDQLDALLKDSATLAAKITAVGTALGNFQTPFDKIALFSGGVRNAVDGVLQTLRAVTDKAATIADLLSSLLGDEITVHFDWQPDIEPWPSDGKVLGVHLGTLFQPHDKHAFIVGVEAKVKKSTGDAKIKVFCALKQFDLILLGTDNGFMKLAFEKIEFRADSSLKMDVDVKFDGIHFIGPLKFVESLKDLIPLDGFSDPPSLDISSKGIDASFSIALPNLAVGVLCLSNLSLGAGFTVPFIGQPLSVRFNFCTRDQPFCLTVSMFGGGGFFGITLDPHGVQLMEAAFEFGAAIAIDFGVASGGVHVMAGIYFRMEKNACSLTGYFRLGGEVSVLAIVSASIELYMSLSYQFSNGKCVGQATLTISVSVFMFSVSVSIHCERQFAGSNGDPSFAALMGPDAGPVTLTTAYPWRDYVEAFA